MSRYHASRLMEVVRPVHDLERAMAFYCEALGFTLDQGDVSAQGPMGTALAGAWGEPPRALVRLRLGAQTLLLAACASAPGLPDQGADDTRFQHIALVTPDINAAWARVLAHTPSAVPITQGGPVRLPAASGGVTACKFRDPEGHPVELLAFGPGQVPERWAGVPGLTQGIDHSAITVADAGQSIAFYDRLLGLQQAARQTNRGEEQARLDGLPAPEVDVVALAPEYAPPHLELLGYRRPAHATPSLPAPAGPRTSTVWEVTSGEDTLPAGTARYLHDPDGHTLLLRGVTTPA